MSDQWPPPSNQQSAATSATPPPHPRFALWIAIAVASVLTVAGAVSATILLNSSESASTTTVTLEPAANPESTTVPASATAAPPAVTPAAVTQVPNPATTTPGADCTLELHKWEVGKAWVEVGDTGLTCPELIAKWRQYEDWTGPLEGTGLGLHMADGTYCYSTSTHWRPGLEGSLGQCAIGAGTFTVWLGDYGQRGVTPEVAPPAVTTTEAGAPAPAPAAGCADSSFHYTTIDGSSPTDCQEMISTWQTYHADPILYANRALPGATWRCFPDDTERGPDGAVYNSPAACSDGAGRAFWAEPLGGNANAGQPQPGGSGGSAGNSAGDLGLSVPMTRPACDGTGIVLLFASVTPGAYAAEIQQALNEFPGSSYLRTDQSCPSLHQATDSGDPIYAVYRVAGHDQAEVCSAVAAAGGSAYGKWLDNTSDPDSDIAC